jgi:hypothetical protein
MKNNFKKLSGNRMAAAAWWYFFSKFTEFFDTFFFLARKKFDNVSTLHVIHHGIMPFFAWQACRFVPGILKSVFYFFAYVVCRRVGSSILAMEPLAPNPEQYFSTRGS